MKMSVLLAAVLLANSAAAQQYQREPDLERIADALYGNRDEDLDYGALYENLASHLASPLDINQATAEDLQLLNILSDAQINNIISYRATNGKLLSVYELQAIPGLDATVCTQLAPFITVAGPTLLTSTPGNATYKNTQGYILLRYEQTIEQQAGFAASEPESRFIGARSKRYLRARLQTDNGLRIGLTAENDAGEAMAWSPRKHQYGFDYLSGYAQVVNQGRIRNLIAGDYQAQFGQGLVYGGLLGMGKGSEAVATVRQPGVGFTPWSSTYEAGNRRGLATTLALNNAVAVSVFVSRNNRDATVQQDSLETTITALQTTGLHRNARELNTRKQTPEQNYGAVLQYKTAGLDAGVIVDHLRLANAVQPRPTVYNRFAFRGNDITNTSLYVNYSKNNVALFTEAAHTLEHGWAGIAGVVISLTRRLDMALLYRHFAANFYSRYGSAFAEASTLQNETGTYWGWKYTASRKFNTTGYADLFRSPWLRYRVYAPAGGYEWMLRLNYQPSKTITGWLQMREEQKARNATAQATLYTITPTLRRQYKAGVEYGPDVLKLRSQALFCTFRTEGHTALGSALVQDIKVRIGRLKCTARYALFDTDTYDTRLYVYENDVWLAYTLPAYSGKGVRKYIMLEYALTRRLTAWVRYARTRYTDRDEISSGLDRIAGNVRNDIKFELRASF